MFVRIKKSLSRSTAVQIVEGVRDATTGRVKQRVIRHIGYAANDAELEDLKELAEYIKAEIEDGIQANLLSPEAVAEMAIEGKKRAVEDKENKNKNKKADTAATTKNYAVDDMRKLRTQQQNITGIHEVYGRQFDALGFDKILAHPSRKVSSQQILRNIVLARIAHPDSKRGSVRFLENQCGISLNLDSVYKAMDYIDDEAIERINQKALSITRKLFPEKIDVLFYDVTTLYFESFTEDELKSKGFSKDHKSQEVQVMLSIFVTKGGLPVGYDLFPGSTYEGSTLLKALSCLKQRFDIDKVVFVADSGMLNEENLLLLESHGYDYIVGARLKNMSKSVTEQILSNQEYTPLSFNEENMNGKIISLKDNRKLVLTYSEKRAKKDSHDRDTALCKLEKKLKKTSSVKSMLSNSGYKKYMTLKGESKVEINQEKIKQASRWDGLHGVVTNMEKVDMRQVVSHYRGLWQIEETFRVTKHDLKIRPIYHWSQKRIKAHIALCFMALVSVRHLEYRMQLTNDKLSPKRIQDALLSVGITMVQHVEDKRLFAIPFNPSDDARKIYKTLGLDISTTPYLI
jgi:transposase